MPAPAVACAAIPAAAGEQDAGRSSLDTLVKSGPSHSIRPIAEGEEATEEKMLAALMASPFGRRMSQREGYVDWLRHGDPGHTPAMGALEPPPRDLPAVTRRRTERRLTPLEALFDSHTDSDGGPSPSSTGEGS